LLLQLLLLHVGWQSPCSQDEDSTAHLSDTMAHRLLLSVCCLPSQWLLGRCGVTKKSTFAVSQAASKL
jgi:hypothetical protein